MPTSSTPSTIRSEIQAKGAEIRNKTGTSVADFDTKTEIVKTPNGTLSSKKSLITQTGKQVGEDAGTTIENAEDAVKGLLKRDKN